jgi:hypothetical protein
MISIHPYATHLPALVGCITATEGPVLELGSGVFSTPVLHTACGTRRLLTADTDEDWMARFRYLESHNHRFALVDEWSRFEAIEAPWDVVLVDQSPGSARAPTIERLRAQARLIVVHDTQAADHYGFEPLLSTFRYRRDFAELGVQVGTTVVSDLVPVPFDLPVVTTNHSTRVAVADSVVIRTTGGGWVSHHLPWPKPAREHFFFIGKLHTDDATGINVQVIFRSGGEDAYWMSLLAGAVGAVKRDVCVPRDAAVELPTSHRPRWTSVDEIVIRAKAEREQVLKMSGVGALVVDEALPA